MKLLKKFGLILALSVGIAANCSANPMPPDPSIDYDSQLHLFARQNQIWDKGMCLEEAIGQDGQLVITDLDNNGRLELLFTTTAGREEYIENWGFEVNEDGNGVVLIKSCEMIDTTVLRQENVPMFFACQENKYYYLFPKFKWISRSDTFCERFDGQSSLCLDQGEFKTELLTFSIKSYDKPDLPPAEVKYYDSLNKPISQAEYEAIPPTHFQYHHPHEVTLGWEPLESLAKVKNDPNLIHDLFAKSWSKYRVEALPEGPDGVHG